MPRVKNTLKGPRINLELSEKSFEMLRNLKNSQEIASYSEGIRKAIKAYWELLQMKQRGDKFLVEDKDGKRTEVIFL